MAQAHGSRSRRPARTGACVVFRFYREEWARTAGPAVVTNDPLVAERVRLLRDHGSRRKYRHEIIGYNFRLEEIQGAVLAVKLRHLDRWNQMRREHAARYGELLPAGDRLQLPRECAYAYHVYHLYVVQTDERDALQKNLKKRRREVSTKVPLPLQPLGLAASIGRLPRADNGARVFRAPSGTTGEQIVRVAEARASATSRPYQEKWVLSSVI